MISLPALEGVWGLERRIEDRRGGVVGHLTGQCVWRPDAHGLRQEEAGVLRMGDAPPMQARRVYLWRETEAGLAVLFEDGRAFHAIDLARGRLRDRHLCPPDTYDVTYEIDDWPHWRQEWVVTGPRKDARIVSDFSPLQGDVHVSG